jgi:ribonuclease R
VPERLDAHRLIEEMMIAGQRRGGRDAGKAPHAADLPRARLAIGRKTAGAARLPGSLNLPFNKADAVKPADFNRTLAKAREEGKIEQVSEMVLRSQAQAEYSPANYGHFGLNLDRYAHFTSPIRRYADLIVHRALITALGWATTG